MRRLALLVTGGAVWLFLAAIPVFADGGPHVLTINNGSSGINADSCAGCHRIHTSKSSSGFLLTSAGTVTDFCLSCHGTAPLGATTDVATGIQYTLATRGTTLGALRGGGFVSARIGSDNAYRKTRTAGSSPNEAFVPVADSTSGVTSAHLAVSDSGLTATNKVWGNGALNSGAGPTLTGNNRMTCGTCHNPHGNGNYRILEELTSLGGATVTNTAGVSVSDATYVEGKTRNYTVIQKAGTAGVEASGWLLYADDVTTGGYNALSGDYFHKQTPFDAANPTSVGALATSCVGASGLPNSCYDYDGPNARPNTSSTTGDYTAGSTIGFSQQITAWCSQCHTRYNASSGARSNSSGDAIFMYRHTSNNSTRTCLTCHVAHGSNAIMDPTATDGLGYSANVPYPDDNKYNLTARSGDSRLLKVDNRGTCLLCHEPTESFDVSTGQGVYPVYPVR